MSADSRSPARSLWFTVATAVAAQVVVFLAIRAGRLALDHGLWIQTVVWCLLTELAVLMGRRMGSFTRAIELREQEHRAALDQMAQLELQNDMLTTPKHRHDFRYCFSASH